MLASSKSKPPPKARHYQDQLSFLDDLLEKREDISIHEKLDMIIDNQKVFFKFMADVMRGRIVGTHIHNDINLGVGHVTNMEGESNVSEGRDSGVSVGRDRASSVSVGRDGERSTVCKDLSQDLGHMSNIQGASSFTVQRDMETLYFVSEDIREELLWKGQVVWERDSQEILFHGEVEEINMEF